MRSQGMMSQHASGNTSNRGSRKMKDKANVYVKMTLLGKDVPCLVDSGCETTMVPKSLCLLYTSPSPRDRTRSRMPSSA